MNLQLNQKQYQLHFELHDSFRRNIAATSEGASIAFCVALAAQTNDFASQPEVASIAF
jgi:hypothetical protein